VAERPRLARDPLRVAVRAHARHRVRARSLDREGARAHLLPGPPPDRLGLAGENRLVDGERGRRLETSVGDDLVARLQLDEVAGDELVHADQSRLAVADDACGRGDEGRQPVEGSLGAELLRDPDRGVADEDREEERVLPRAEGERDEARDEQDHVEDGEDVRPHDARVRAARGGRLDRPALGEPPPRLLLRQAGQRLRCIPRLDQASEATAPTDS
jgi:hypothetical protein